MNKKFSTLVVACLATGAFMGTANAQTKLSGVVDDKAVNGNVFYLSDAAVGGTNSDRITSYVKGQMTGATEKESVTPATAAGQDAYRVDLKNDAYYQWVAVKVGNDGTANLYSFKNVATGKMYSGATAGTPLVYKASDLGGYSAGSISVYNIDTRSLTADDLNNMDSYKNAFTLQFVDGTDHKTPYTFIDNVFVGKSIVARDAAKAFFTYKEATTSATSELKAKEGILLQIEGNWDGKAIYTVEKAYLDFSGTLREVEYPKYNADQLAAFRASKFIVLGDDQYSQFATDIDGQENIKGYKFAIVTGAELLGKLITDKEDAANTYKYDEVESIYNVGTAKGWDVATTVGTTDNPELPNNNTEEIDTYTKKSDLQTSVTRPFDNAIFKLYVKGTTAKSCVNDVIIEMPAVYKHGVNADGEPFYREYKYEEGTGNDVTTAIAASVFDFEGQKYVCAINESAVSSYTHPTFVTNAFIEGMLVQPKDFVAKKVVNVTYYAKQDQYGDWVNFDRKDKNVRRDASWTWGPSNTEDVLKQFVDFTVPEGQWLINYNANTNTYAFVNMENQTVMPENIRLVNGELKGYNTATTAYDVANWVGFKLYDNGDDHYTATTSEYDNDLYLTITAAAEGDNMHGYTNFNDKQLENGFNIAVITDLMGNVYLKEDHATNHKATFDADKDNASVWRLQKFTAAKDYVKGIEASDTIRIINPYSVWNAAKQIFEVKADTVEALAYAIRNDYTGEYLAYNADENAYYCDTKEYSNADVRTMKVNKFVLKEKTINGKTGVNVLPAWIGNKLNEKDYGKTDDIKASAWWTNKLIGSFSENKLAQDVEKYRIVDNDLFAVTPVDAPVYITMNPAMDTVKIYRDENTSEFLYEKGHFLGMEHIADVPAMKAAMFVDTAYVRNNTVRPQYLLVVGAKQVISKEECTIPGHPKHQADTLSGRFLVNMVDSMFALGSSHVNPYKWDLYPKLAFMEGMHTHDTLFLNTANGVKAFDLSQNAKNVATVAFRYVDRATGSFIMEVGTHTGNGNITTGYLKWLNGTPVVVNDIELAEILNMAATSEAPTANEGISASEVSIVAGNGVVVVKNAAGKNVAISNILGKSIANVVLSSDNETISVPAGIVVVSVEGEEAVKAVVK